MSHETNLPQSKAAVLASAGKARRRGKTWSEAFDAAKKVGYTGDLQDLIKMMRAEAARGFKASHNDDEREHATISRTLASITEYAFDSEVQSRGERYYYEQTVSIGHSCSTAVVAQVKGSRSYTVTLDLLKDELIVDCDCPYFAANGPCKHIWATILASDANKFIMPPTDCLDLKVTPADKIDDAPEDDEEADESEPCRQTNIVRLADHRQVQPPAAPWKIKLDELWRGEQSARLENRGTSPADLELLYIIDVPGTMNGYGLVVEVQSRQRKLNGALGPPKPCVILRKQVAAIPDPLDRQVLSMLTGASATSFGFYGNEEKTNRFLVPPGLQETLCPVVLRTGRCHLRRQLEDKPTLLQVDDGPPWEFHLEVTKPTNAQYLVRGSLRRGEEHRDLAEPVMLVAGGWVFWPDRVARLNDGKAFQWINMLRRERELQVPIEQGAELIAQICRFERFPHLDLPEDLRFEQVSGAPRPRLTLKKPEESSSDGKVCAELSFDYAGSVFPANPPMRAVFLAEQRRMILRDQKAERDAAMRLHQLGFRSSTYRAASIPELDARKLPAVVRALIAENWHVEAEGKFYRAAGNFSISVRSGIDWFELHGSVDFDGATASFPALLAALKKGEDIVRLDDGSFGLLPEEWLKKFGLLVGAGAVHEDHLRFTAPQASVLDALLSAQPHATCDATFTRVRTELQRFDAIKPAKPPRTFSGTLRPYQEDGLGWLDFLRRFGFGGCLADDMGLGKTIQVLAMLESRRAERSKEDKNTGGPALAVVPRSLVFNWKLEAERFTPKLRVLDYTGAARVKGAQEHFENYDLVLTTYGTLRRDALHLKDIRFDYVILDEAQAIKNADTASAKAARLMQGRHRLCLSGTPIENHLGELWSIFEFLNPGMLGAASVFKLGINGERAPDEQTRALLARALRPFILRRTKSQVAKDLPEKTEQTLFCELDGAQRALYDELRDHYREALLGRIAREGINKAKIQILEALLRLRQAACHPGLIDKRRTSESSAKLEALLPQLAEVLEEGHKALVFSQFTSMLAIVRERLDAEKISYEYLDGKTRDRQAKVERFQNDPECKLFLISLKAGGLGLNLTAAEYVFLLDPWWNPAVEAQAIDRAHRIGQTRQVFAYRLIARDTVEEKILELQRTKRDLADAIINADNSLIRTLGREELELLLS